MAGEKEKSNKGLIILLAVLLVVIIGLGVGIGVVKMRGDSPAEIVGQTRLEASIADGYYPGNEKSDEAFEYNYNYLKNMIESGRTEDGQQLDEGYRVSLKVVLARLLTQYEKPEEALMYLDSINQDSLSYEKLLDVYVTYSLVYQGLGDEEKALTYVSAASFVNDRIYSAEEGIDE